MKDEEFVMISEYIQITENIDDNRIDFTINEDDTQFRVYLETGDLLLNLKDRKTDLYLQQYKPISMTGTLAKGEYSIFVDFFTDLSKK